jgi:ubiquinone/menaquinone biosynthesis C-methylase UbiE
LSFTDRFSSFATAYAAARPSYPSESVAVLFEGMPDPKTLKVVDVGAGTGISARLIADQGPHVYALEPNAKMRDAAAPDERITWVDGTGEATTLPDASVDVVAAFQAWHWVDHPVALLEAQRILKPGGRLAAIYNERDETDPFTHAYGLIVCKYAIDATEDRRFSALRRFEEIAPDRTKRFEYRNVHMLDRAGVHKRAESSSYLPQEGEAAEAMHFEIDELCNDYEGPAGELPMTLVTIVVRVDA